MKLLLFSGNHSRHIFFHEQLIKNFNVAGIVCMYREKQLLDVPKGIKDLDKKNFIRHFEERNDIEFSSYGDLNEDYFEGKAPLLKVFPKELNSFKVLDFIKKIDADACFIFGVDLILDPIINNLPKFTLNLHLGLSPWYKGSATLFWPFYFLEPQFCGTTIHFIEKNADAGDIIHQFTPTLEFGQGIHEVAANAVLGSVSSVIRIYQKFKNGEKILGEKQKSTGRLFLTRDFHPTHLRLIYNTFQNKIVDYYLENKLKQEHPKIIKLH